MNAPDSASPLAVVQRLYQAFGNGDAPGMLALLADDLDWQFHADHRAPYTGRCDKAGFPAWLGAVAAADDIQAFEPREFLAGPDHVTVLGWERTVARTTGRSFECHWVHVFTVRDGRIVRFVGLLDSERAGAARA
jgi:hypothetical protein